MHHRWARADGFPVPLSILIRYGVSPVIHQHPAASRRLDHGRILPNEKKAPIRNDEGLYQH